MNRQLIEVILKMEVSLMVGCSPIVVHYYTGIASTPFLQTAAKVHAANYVQCWKSLVLSSFSNTEKVMYLRVLHTRRKTVPSCFWISMEESTRANCFGGVQNGDPLGPT